MRYTVSIEYYMEAENDHEAVKKAMADAKQMDGASTKGYDAKVLAIHRTPFATLICPQIYPTKNKPKVVRA